MPARTRTSEPATPTSSTANTNPKHMESEAELSELLISMRKDIASLRAVQNAANKEIHYLRMNTDRIVRDAGTEMRRMRKHLRLAQAKIRQMDDVQKELLRKLRLYEGTPTPSPTPSPQSRPRRLELRRQGAFSCELEDISWAKLNDVRGYNPSSLRYHYDENGPSPGKRSRADIEDEEDEDNSLPAPHSRYQQPNDAWASQRRRGPALERSANPSPSVLNGFFASVFC